MSLLGLGKIQCRHFLKSKSLPLYDLEEHIQAATLAPSHLTELEHFNSQSHIHEGDNGCSLETIPPPSTSPFTCTGHVTPLVSSGHTWPGWKKNRVYELPLRISWRHFQIKTSWLEISSTAAYFLRWSLVWQEFQQGIKAEKSASQVFSGCWEMRLFMCMKGMA